MGSSIMMANYLVLIFLIFGFNYVRCDSAPISDCNFGTCGTCIGAPERCVWCSIDEMADNRRCRPLSYLNTTKSWCKDGTIFNPQPIMTIEKSVDFGPTVQFKPQLIKMKARPGVPMKFTMSFKPAEDFPLDVYYLMDVSDTMKSKLTDLKKQAKQIYKDLSAYTNNVKLGIGSFVEKPGFPFFDPNKHESDAFRNEVPLTKNMTLFMSKIDTIKPGSNFDDPEAGLDALMQAMKCDEVGWRENARHIIVLCTDSTYHSAGDGKIVGAIKPHDMKCHLKDHKYSEALTYDYPSVSQINQAAIDGNFKLIFAITENIVKHTNPEKEYQKLTSQLDAAKYAKLEGGNSVLQIIKEAYEQLSNTVPLTYKALPFVEVTIDQNCDSKPLKNCETPHKQIVHIPGTVTAKACPPNGAKNQKQIVTINPKGLADKLTIELDVDCECDCEKVHGAIDPAKCHGAGFLQCGVCKCQPGSYGVDCRCNGTSTDQKDLENCKLNAGDSKLCSGRGTCRCGKCEECQSGFSGDYCEFDDKSCPKPKNKLCSGQGTCYRGKCQCEAHWTGADCSCPDHDMDCYAPYSTQVCSGKGTCVCGVCQCDKVKGKNETHSGAFCDSSEERCKDLENYAYCNYMHVDNKTFCDQENKNVSTAKIEVSFVNKAEINGPNLYMAKWCKKELDASNGTYMVFKYQYEKKYLKISIQKELETPPEPNYWIACGSAIGLVLLIGILTVIIWKILVDLHDKKEYEKFSTEALAQGYDVSQNPLYQEPAINFSNPVYNNQCS